jgi:hypothetical protein
MRKMWLFGGIYCLYLQSRTDEKAREKIVERSKKYIHIYTHTHGKKRAFCFSFWHLIHCSWLTKNSSCSPRSSTPVNLFLYKHLPSALNVVFLTTLYFSLRSLRHSAPRPYSTYFLQLVICILYAKRQRPFPLLNITTWKEADIQKLCIDRYENPRPYNVRKFLVAMETY